MTSDVASSTHARLQPGTRAPLIDVLIPVFNGVSTIESAISSIQAQTVTDIRIIVVNDGSTDGSKQAVERLAAADGRVMLVDQPNGGIVDALNAGLARCTADIIARHDADDLANPDRFERQLKFLREHPGCVAVSGAIRPINVTGNVIGPVLEMPSPELADFNECPQREPYLIHPFLMMRRSAVEAVGGYRHVHHAEDTDLYWRLAEIGSLANMPDLLGDLRIHPESITAKSVLNGRISALNSQLSGISASRRRRGRVDLTFLKAALSDYQQAGSLEGVIRAGSRTLDASEAAQLAPAVSAKLLELSSHRPYELDGQDCSYIRKTLALELPRMTPSSRTTCIRMLSGTAARLLAQNKISAALRLAPLRLYPLVAARLMLRTGLPLGLRRKLRQAAGRAVLAK
jgi:glycosyltransferase involved in cell wall biosynthesis